MALCDNSVLTGQEGSIAFKPPGTSVCVRDWSAFGTDGTTSHITLECGADFRVGDVVVFTEESGGNLDSALMPGTPRGVNTAIGGVTRLGSFTGGGNYGISGSYSGVATTGGQGTGATLNITTSAAGVVDSVSIADGGQGYTVSDGLTVDEADIGGTGTGGRRRGRRRGRIDVGNGSELQLGQGSGVARTHNGDLTLSSLLRSAHDHLFVLVVPS